MLYDAFSASRLRPKSVGIEEEVKEKHSKKTVFNKLDEKRVRQYRDKFKKNAPELYNSLTKKVFRRAGAE